MHIVIPLAGQDAAFEKLGLPKPLALVEGKPIIQHIGESRPYSFQKAIFILLREHQKKYQIDQRLIRIFGDRIQIVWAEQLTGGAPQSILLAKGLINNEEPLLIDLADQYLDLPGFAEFINKQKADGVIPTFESYYPNRGYMRYGANGRVSEISEKDPIPISTHSTACISFFRKGSDFVSAAEKMIEKKKVAANGAYLVSPAYNELIESGKAVLPFQCDFIASLGTVSGSAAFGQLSRPLRCSKEIFRVRFFECPFFQHRGIRKHPENSLAAIEASLNAMRSVEIDLRRTKDGVFVLSHDDDLERTTGKALSIADSDYKTLSSLHLKGSEEKIATLDSALDLLAARAFGVFAIHVKDKATSALVKEICGKIIMRRLENRVFLFGDWENSSAVAQITKSLHPDINVGLHIHAKSFNSKNVPAYVDVFWADEEKKEMSALIPESAKKRGALSAAMSPELTNPKATEKEASARCKEFFSYGFDAVCTDFF